MKWMVFIVGLSISLSTFAVDIYNDFGVEMKSDYSQLGSKINPDNLFEMQEGYKSKFGIYYKNSMFFNGFSMNIADLMEYSYIQDAENSFNNKVLEFYGTTNLFGNFLDIGKKKSVRSISFSRGVLDFDNTNDNIKKDDKDLKYKEGKIQLNYEIFTQNGVLGITYYPETDFEDEVVEKISSNQNAGYEARFIGYKGNSEYTIIGAKDDIYRFGGNISTVVNNNLGVHIEGAYLEEVNRYELNKTDITDEIFTLELDEYTEENGIQLVTGINYYKSGYSVRGEYFYNNYGLDGDSWDNKLKLMEESRELYDQQGKYKGVMPAIAEINRGNLGNSLYFLGNNGLGNIGKHYFMGRVSIDDFYKTEVSAITLMNLQDLSGMLILSGDYYAFDRFNISLNPQINYGKKYSEYRLIGDRWKVSLGVNWDY